MTCLTVLIRVQTTHNVLEGALNMTNMSLHAVSTVMNPLSDVLIYDKIKISLKILLKSCATGQIW